MEKSVVVEKNKVTEAKMTEVTVSALNQITGKYLVKPCQRTWLHENNPDHDGAILFTKAEIWIPAANDSVNPDMLNTGLSKQEQVEFEQEMNLAPGTLSPYNKVYWAKLNNIIKIPKDGLTLDCDNNIKHKFQLRILQGNSMLVAKSQADLALNPMAQVVITSIGEEAKIDSQKFMVKSKAYAKFNTMSQNDKINYLKVFNDGKMKVSKNTNPELIDATIGKIVDSTPDQFLLTFDDAFYKDYILLEDLISNSIITKKGGRFFVNGGIEIGITKAQVVSNLRSDEYQDLKISLMSKLEAVNK